MKSSAKILFNIGKAWVALILFIAMVLSTIISLPFVMFGKFVDVYNIYRIKSHKNPVTYF